jgi:hypothetical protein
MKANTLQEKPVKLVKNSREVARIKTAMAQATASKKENK